MEEGWVEEVVIEGHGRSRPVAVSEAGRKLMIAAAPAWRTAQEEARKLFGDSNVAAIIGVADSLPLNMPVD